MNNPHGLYLVHTDPHEDPAPLDDPGEPGVPPPPPDDEEEQ